MTVYDVFILLGGVGLFLYGMTTMSSGLRNACGENLKNIVMKGIEVIGNKASNIASNAKQKVGEFNLANEQKELFCVIGSKALELSKKGSEFPEELKEDLKKAAEIGDELDRIRAEKETAEKAANTDSREDSGYRETPEEAADDTIPDSTEYAAKDDRDVPVIEVDETEDADEKDFSDCPLSSAISDLFEKMPPVDKMMDKVNSSLDELGDNLKKFSDDFGKQLDEFADRMMDKDDNDPQDRS